MAHGKPITIPALTGGVNLGAARGRLAPHQSPAAQNFWTRDGVLETRFGFTDNFLNLAGTGPFLGAHWYQCSVAGSGNLWALCRQKAWIQSSPGGSWTDKTNSMNIQAGDDQYVVWAECVEKNDYKNYLLVCQNHTDMSTALNGTVTGDESIIWYANDPAGNLTALAGADGYNHAAGDALHRAKCLAVFEGSVFLANTYEATGAGPTWRALPYRIRWSNPQEFTTKDDWDPTVTASLAGFTDLREGYGPIYGMQTLGGRLYPLCQRAIYVGLKNDSATAPFLFWPKVESVGLYGPRFNCKAGGRIFFVGSDREVYQYWGGPEPEPIGGKILSGFFGDLNRAANGDYLKRDRGSMAAFPDQKAVLLIAPTTGEYPTDGYLYYWLDRKWDKIVLAESWMGAGLWPRPAGQESENLVVMGTDLGDSYSVVPSANSGASGCTATLETQDLVVDLGRIQATPALWFEANCVDGPQDVTVKVSTDGGSNWAATNTISVAAGWASYKAPFNVKGFQLRFQFGISNSKLQLGRMKVIFTDGEEVR